MFVWLARGGELDALVSAISCGSRGCLCSIPPPSSVPRLGWCTRSPALSFVVSITMPWISRPSQWRRRPCARRAWAAFVCRRGGEHKPDPPPCPRCCRSRWVHRTRRRSCAWPPVDHMNVAAGCAGGLDAHLVRPSPRLPAPRPSRLPPPARSPPPARRSVFCGPILHPRVQTFRAGDSPSAHPRRYAARVSLMSKSHSAPPTPPSTPVFIHSEARSHQEITGRGLAKFECGQKYEYLFPHGTPTPSAPPNLLHSLMSVVGC